MVGHKLGEFAPTRTFKGHTPADKKAAAESAASTTSASKPSPGTATPASKPEAKGGEGSNAKK